MESTVGQYLIDRILLFRTTVVPVIDVPFVDGAPSDNQVGATVNPVTVPDATVPPFKQMFIAEVAYENAAFDRDPAGEMALEVARVEPPPKFASVIVFVVAV